MPILQEEPWQTVEGIEFRSATVIAYTLILRRWRREDAREAALLDQILDEDPYG